MADITELLKNILSKVYGKDVRQSIHDAIQQCYLDGKVGAIDMVARARIDNLVAQNNDTSGNSELKDIRVGVDGKTYASAGEAVRAQIEKANGLLEELDAHMESARDLLTVNYADMRFFELGSLNTTTGAIEESSKELTSILCKDFKGKSFGSLSGYQTRSYRINASGKVTGTDTWTDNDCSWPSGASYEGVRIGIRKKDGSDITKKELDGLVFTDFPELRKFCNIRKTIQELGGK